MYRLFCSNQVFGKIHPLNIEGRLVVINGIKEKLFSKNSLVSGDSTIARLLKMATEN